MIYGFNDKKEKVEISGDGFQTVTQDANGNVDITGNLDVGGGISVDGDVGVSGGITTTTVNGRNPVKFLTRADFSTTQYTVPAVGVAANSDSGSKIFSITREGYYPFAIADFNLTGTNRMYQNLYELDLSNRAEGSAQIIYRFRNNANVSVSIGLNVSVLWIKTL